MTEAVKASGSADSAVRKGRSLVTMVTRLSPLAASNAVASSAAPGAMFNSCVTACCCATIARAGASRLLNDCTSDGASVCEFCRHGGEPGDHPIELRYCRRQCTQVRGSLVHELAERVTLVLQRVGQRGECRVELRRVHRGDQVIGVRKRGLQADSAPGTRRPGPRCPLRSDCPLASAGRAAATGSRCCRTGWPARRARSRCWARRVRSAFRSATSGRPRRDRRAGTNGPRR